MNSTRVVLRCSKQRRAADSSISARLSIDFWMNSSGSFFARSRIVATALSHEASSLDLLISVPITIYPTFDGQLLTYDLSHYVVLSHVIHLDVHHMHTNLGQGQGYANKL